MERHEHQAECKLQLWGRNEREDFTFVFSAAGESTPADAESQLFRVEVNLPSGLRRSKEWQELPSRHRLALIFPQVQNYLEDRGLPSTSTIRMDWAPRSLYPVGRTDAAYFRSGFAVPNRQRAGVAS